MSEKDKFCANCGSPVTADQNFCFKCGSPVNSSQTPSPESSTPASSGSEESRVKDEINNTPSPTESEVTQIIPKKPQVTPSAPFQPAPEIKKGKEDKAAAEKPAAPRAETANNPAPEAPEEPVLFTRKKNTAVPKPEKEQPVYLDVEPVEEDRVVPPADNGNDTNILPPPPKRDNKPLVIIIIVLGLLIIGGAVWFFFFYDKPSGRGGGGGGGRSSRSERVEEDTDTTKKDTTAVNIINENPVPIPDNPYPVPVGPSNNNKTTEPTPRTDDTRVPTGYLNGYVDNIDRVNMVIYSDRTGEFCLPDKGLESYPLKIEEYNQSTGHAILGLYDNYGQYLGYWDGYETRDTFKGTLYLGDETHSFKLQNVPAYESVYGLNQ